MMTTLHIHSPVGTLRLTETDGKLAGLHFAKGTPPDSDCKTTPLLAAAKTQLEEYFAGTRKEFDLPLAPKGTPFQMRVWEALRTIPYGTTWTYKQLAEAADSPKGYRAAGLANNRNPISIIVPCHRVIGSNGALVGFGGGLDAKKILLDLESGIQSI